MSKRVAPQAENRANGTIPEANYPYYVPKLIAAFQNDFTVVEACEYAGIPRRTFYNHLESDPTFAEEMRKAREFPKIVAKKRVMHIINFGNDKEAGAMARWFLERRDPDTYGKKVASKYRQEELTSL